MTDRDRLIELLKPHVSGTACLCESGSCELTSCRDCKARRLADYLLANGVIVPPCKVGAEIFGIFDNDDEQRKEIYEGKILCYSLDENNLLWARMRYKNGLTYWHTIDDFGKTVFLTKEEAEEKLRELKENA